MLHVSFKFMYLLMRLLMLLFAQYLLPLYRPLKRANQTLNAHKTLFIAAAQIACPKIFLKFLSEFMQFLNRLRRQLHQVV